MRIDSDEKLQKYLFLGYEYTIAKVIMNKGITKKNEASKELTKYILMNIRDFNIHPDRGRANKINKAIPNILWYFED